MSDFAKAVASAVRDQGEDAVADAFGVCVRSVLAWAAGEREPHPAMKRAVLDKMQGDA